MALTTEQEIILKEIADKEIKQKAIDVINASANVSIGAKKDEIQSLENKRIADIKLLDK